jgi:hypothetical protein
MFVFDAKRGPRMEANGKKKLKFKFSMTEVELKNLRRKNATR